MKNINHQEIILDIEKRIKFFNEIRINKIITVEIESIQEIKTNDFVDKKSRSTIVKEGLISKDVFESELFYEKKIQIEEDSIKQNLAIEDVSEKRGKIEHFTKKDDFLLKENDKHLVKQKKEATNNFFKTISNFFDGKSNENELINTTQVDVEEIKIEKMGYKSKKNNRRNKN